MAKGERAGGGEPSGAPASPGLSRDDPLRGILFILCSAACSAMMNSAARYVSESIHPFEVVFFRNLFAFLFLAPVLLRYGSGLLKTRRFGAHMGRACLNVINMLAFFYAISITPLAEVVALSFTAPIFATILAVVFLREVVGLHRWSAILAGFAGAMIVLQPGFETILSGQMLVLGSALTWAGCLLIIKSLSHTDSSMTIVAYMAILMTPMSLGPALFVWQWPDAHQLFWLVLIGVLGGATQFTLAQALQNADLGLVMPFDFSKLIWVSLIGFVAFGEVPLSTTWIGGALIFASGVYIVRRERKTRSEIVRALE